MSKLYKNKKTGKLYIILTKKVINTTNAQDGQEMVAYMLIESNEHVIYVRESDEFYNKFEKYENLL